MVVPLSLLLLPPLAVAGRRTVVVVVVVVTVLPRLPLLDPITVVVVSGLSMITLRGITTGGGSTKGMPPGMTISCP